MNSDEFWCRAFLSAMRDHAGDLERCQEIADAALWRAQRRGMVTGERTGARPVTQADVAQAVSDYLYRGAQIDRPAPEAVEFTAEPYDQDHWAVSVPGYRIRFLVSPGNDTFDRIGGDVFRVQWGKTCPPKPIKVWLERKGGA
jgi:hypothetical protein